MESDLLPNVSDAQMAEEYEMERLMKKEEDKARLNQSHLEVIHRAENDRERMASTKKKVVTPSPRKKKTKHIMTQKTNIGHFFKSYKI